VLSAVSAVMIIMGLGGILLGLVWAVLRVGWQDLPLPFVLGLGLVGIGWLIPAAAPVEPVVEPLRTPAGDIPGTALLQPTPMIATHTRRAYALSEAGEVSQWGEPIPDPLAADGPVARISVGREHMCVLRPSGQLACWGEQRERQASPPDGTFVALTSGTEHSCALTEAGEPICWGRHDSRIDPPDGLRLTTLSASDRHTCGLDAQGQVHCWGCDSEQASACDAPEGRFIQVSAGHHHTCGLGADLQVSCWGSDEAGQSSPPVAWFTSVSAGWTQTCATTPEGAIACWGCGGRLQKLDPSQANHCRPPSGRFKALSSGDIWGSCAVRVLDDEPVCWGGSARTDEPR
jgi:hypothetical protein